MNGYVCVWFLFLFLSLCSSFSLFARRYVFFLACIACNIAIILPKFVCISACVWTQTSNTNTNWWLKVYIPCSKHLQLTAMSDAKCSLLYILGFWDTFLLFFFFFSGCFTYGVYRDTVIRSPRYVRLCVYI